MPEPTSSRIDLVRRGPARPRPHAQPPAAGRRAPPPSDDGAPSPAGDPRQASAPAAATPLLPWRAQGRGFVFAGLRHAPRREEREAGLDTYGGLGALAVVDYASSPVQAYRELAWQPGEVVAQGRRHSHITHICVDSPASVRHGRRLFALDKQLAAMTWSPPRHGDDEVVTAARPGEADAVVCRIRRLGSWRLRLPAAWSAWLMPPLYQQALTNARQGDATVTPLQVSAEVGLAWLSDLRSSGALLPPRRDLHLCPLGLSVDDFTLVLDAPSRAVGPDPG